MKKFFSIILVIVMLFMVGCGTTNNTEGKAIDVSSGKELASIDEYLVGGGGDWGYPSPYAMIPRGPGFVRMQLVFDSLIWKDKNGEFIPQIAKEWSYDEENNQYSFVINDGIKWHDGEAFSVEDVVFTVNYMKEHKLPWMNLDCISKVEAVDDNKVVITTAKPFAPFLSNIAASMPVLPKHIFENIENPLMEKSEKICIGCGPFSLKEYNPEECNYAFEGFKGYYQGEPKVKELKFIAMSNEMKPSALMQGKLDLIMPSGDALKQIEDKGLNTVSSVGMITKLRFNQNKAPFDSKEFRQAIAYAIDTNEVINTAQRGFPYKGEVGIIQKNSKFYFSDVPQYEKNLEKSKEILKALGYEKKDGYYAKDGNVLEIELLGHDRVKRDVDVIAKQLNESGIKTTAVYKDLATCDQYLLDWNFDISVLESGATGDPMFLNRDILSQSGMSDRYENPKMKELLLKQITAKNEEERKEILENFQKLYAEELPSYVLYYSKFNAAYNDKLEVYFTQDGFSIGIPLPYNKMMFVK